jgi:hypothetical protein
VRAWVELGRMSRTATDELRAIQELLKARYREEPAAALITLQADGSLDDGVACTVNTGRSLARAGLHPASGGDGTLACSGDMLLQALVACAGGHNARGRDVSRSGGQRLRPCRG